MKKWTVLLILAVVAGCGVNLHPIIDDWYALHYFIMQDFEKTAYKDLAVEDRGKFQTMFWDARTSKARQEFQNRLEYVNKFHKNENTIQPWNTDRSRVFLLNGLPDQITETKGFDKNDYRGGAIGGGGATSGFSTVDRSGEDITSMTAVIWQYQHKEQSVRYTFQHATPREFKLLSIGQFEKEFEQFNKDTLYRIGDKEKYALGLKSLKKLK
jgi:GWxTD domain-containing protein